LIRYSDCSGEDAAGPGRGEESQSAVVAGAMIRRLPASNRAAVKDLDPQLLTIAPGQRVERGLVGGGEA
jgi:hypothetical protein